MKQQQEAAALTDRGDEAGVEGILTESEQDARLTHSRITDQQQLEQVIVSFCHYVYLLFSPLFFLLLLLDWLLIA